MAPAHRAKTRRLATRVRNEIGCQEKRSMNRNGTGRHIAGVWDGQMSVFCVYLYEQLHAEKLLRRLAKWMLNCEVVLDYPGLSGHGKCTGWQYPGYSLLR